MAARKRRVTKDVEILAGLFSFSFSMVGGPPSSESTTFGT
jgi:hypothetical protein